MDRKEMTVEQLQDLFPVRIPEFAQLAEGRQRDLATRAWTMLQQDVPWAIVLSATRTATTAGAGNEALGVLPVGSAWSEDERVVPERPDPRLSIDPGDLAHEAPPPLRREVRRYEREQLAAATRQAIRMGRQARRWHEIRKMRNVLLGIDQGQLKRVLGAESEALNQQINALLRSWAPLVREDGISRKRRRR